MLDFRKQLAKKLIHNSYDDKDDAKTFRKSRQKIEAHSHEILSLPKETKFDSAKVVESVSLITHNSSAKIAIRECKHIATAFLV